ncbi:MAG: RES family NAD+ phosphorylase [Candidatus Methylumidiphilus sp.]
MSTSFANLPMDLVWFEQTYWRTIGCIPANQTALMSLTDDEGDTSVGRKLMEKLGPKPFAIATEDFSESVLHWPLWPSHWSASRFSDGQSYGLLYAAMERETALAEAKHCYGSFFADVGVPLASAPRQQRGLFTFQNSELLADTRKAVKKQSLLMADDHTWCRTFGYYLANHLQSGWAYRSARCENGSAIALLRAENATSVQWMETIDLGGESIAGQS